MLELQKLLHVRMLTTELLLNFGKAVVVWRCWIRWWVQKSEIPQNVLTSNLLHDHSKTWSTCAWNRSSIISWIKIKKHKLSKSSSLFCFLHTLFSYKGFFLNMIKYSMTKKTVWEQRRKVFGRELKDTKEIYNRAYVSDIKHLLL